MNDEIELNGDDAGTADFDTGFTGAPTATPEQQVDTQKSTSEQHQEPVQDQQKQQFRQITEDEFSRLSASAAAIDEMRATLGKQSDTVFGKIGGLERMLKQFQDQTPSGSAVEITEDDLAELRDEFPELVGPQLKALQRIASKMRGTGSSAEFDEGRLHQSVSPLLDKASDGAVMRVKSEIAAETLDETNPDWKQIIGLPDENGAIPETDYRKWLSTQPPEYQARIGDSFSPIVIGRSIDKFLEHQTSLKKNAERRDRFEQAITPQGDGGDDLPPEGDDAFNAGYNGR